MPRNSTGNYTLPLPPVVQGDIIEAPWANTSLDDIGQALTDSLDRYGRGGMLAAFLFADGTTANPGAAWANAPGTGFSRDGSALWASWAGQPIFNYNANGIAMIPGTEIFLPDAPATVTSAVNKAYVDAKFPVGGYLPLSGGTMTGREVFKADAGGVAWRNFADTAEAWSVNVNGAADNYFGLFNHGLGSWVFQVNPANNTMLFTGLVYAASFNLPSDHLIYDTGGNLGFRVSADGPYFTMLESGVFQANNGGGTFGGPVLGNDTVSARTSERNTDIGQGSSAGWPGIRFYWGGFYERWITMDSTGNMRCFQGNTPSFYNFVLSPAGDLRCTSFTATPTP